MSDRFPIQIGMNGRFFPQHWRPATAEICQARQMGFNAIQFPGEDNGLGQARLGDTPQAVRAALDAQEVTAVMEIAIYIQANGRTKNNQAPLDILHANLPTICTLGCTAVHWHLIPETTFDTETQWAVERSVYPSLAEGVRLGQEHGFLFGLEHNAPNLTLFQTPTHMDAALTAVSDLGFVWDFNHTHPAHLPGFLALVPRATMLHISDAPLPQYNFHWPLGQGNIDFVAYCQTLLDANFQGVAVLEIGGTPWSGGFGQDTDAALMASRLVWQQAISQARQTRHTP